jgi:hypothetical protein
MRLPLILAALFLAGCASMPDLQDGGLAIARSGWRMTGGADFERKAWFLLLWRPWGQAESDAAAAADKIVIP